MRIDELITIPKSLKNMVTGDRPVTKNDFKSQVDAIVRQFGLKLLGDGTYGLVYEVPGKDYVLKIYSRDDKAYTKWLTFCKANTGNKWLPKIFGKPISFNLNLRAARLERLTPFGGSNELPNLLELVVSRYDLLKISGEGTSYYDRLEAAIPGIFTDAEFETVVRYLAKHKDELDITNENIMLRNDQLVFTDPTRSR